MGDNMTPADTVGHEHELTLSNASMAQDDHQQPATEATTISEAKSETMEATTSQGSDSVAVANASKRRKTGALVNGVPVKGGWDELPHNMGTVSAAEQRSTTAQSEPADGPAKETQTRAPSARQRSLRSAFDGVTDTAEMGQGATTTADLKNAFPTKCTAPKKKTAKAVADVKRGEGIKVKQQDIVEDAAAASPPAVLPTPKKTPRKRAPAKPKAAAKAEGEAGDGVTDEAPLKTPKPRAPRRKTTAQQPSPATFPEDEDAETTQAKRPSAKRARKAEEEESEFEGEPKPKKRRASRAKKLDTSQDVQHLVDKLGDAVEGEANAKKPKANKYGITPGQSSYPDWPLPTKEACYEVNRLLAEEHGAVEQPKTIPPPSLEVTGCGEVPSVLDALIRTRLSAATTGTNSAYAFEGLVKMFGVRDSGIGKGSVDWNKVREADVKQIEKAIHRGGLAVTKSKSIKEILNMVYEENTRRREAFVKEKEEGGEKAQVVGADTLEQGTKDFEIAAADQDVLTLDYMHGLTPDEAMPEFTKYPGIGVKTASCVILFCLRHPSFAVDTHVFRLSKWLKWIPENATRDKAFSHLEVRVPQELKYPLHQLFIRHGKTCGRCRAATGESSEAWMETKCPIEHLVERSGKRKGGPMTTAELKKRKKAKKNDDGDTESELSDIDEECDDLLSGESDRLPLTPEGDVEEMIMDGESKSEPHVPKKRAPRKKDVNEEDTPLDDAVKDEELVPEPASAVTKPTPKKRAPRKKKTVAETADADTPMDDVVKKEEVAPESASAVAKPVTKKRAPRKKMAPKKLDAAELEGGAENGTDEVQSEDGQAQPIETKEISVEA